jgi:hypothetical protein
MKYFKVTQLKTDLDRGHLAPCIQLAVISLLRFLMIPYMAMQLPDNKHRRHQNQEHPHRCQTPSTIDGEATRIIRSIKLRPRRMPSLSTANQPNLVGVLQYFEET